MTPTTTSSSRPGTRFFSTSSCASSTCWWTASPRTATKRWHMPATVTACACSTSVAGSATARAASRATLARGDAPSASIARRASSRLRAPRRKRRASPTRNSSLRTCRAKILRGPYDAAFSRFGTMFFNLPGAALRNIRKSLAPGGEFFMIVWRRREENPWLHDAELCVRGLVPVVKHEDTDQVHCGPGPFSMSGPDLVSTMLRSAGLRTHRVRALRCRHLHRPRPGRGHRVRDGARPCRRDHAPRRGRSGEAQAAGGRGVARDARAL